MRYTPAMAWRALQFPIKIHRSGLLLESSCLFDMIYLRSLPNSKDPEEQVDVDGDNEAEETMEEEVEYEEVEEEEEIEEEVEEEVEEEEIEEAADEADSQRGSDGAEEIDEERKHAELLALPPHDTDYRGVSWWHSS
ncbi:hypothetical protein OIU84_026195 [Salix udensis]|uniref:Uncharacterized protein n=1 Tax=Salix udensis TaxID=889485 RepID=A0AAD6KLB2_9ROSI|nr:hypothetical protein OIU84_026195 [Salix udensis]